MNRQITIYILSIVMAGMLVFTAAGCQQRATSTTAPPGEGLRVGFIDSDALMSDYPEFIKLNAEKERERPKILQLLTKKTPTEQDQKEIDQITRKYMTKENEIIGTFVEMLKEHTRKVAEEKKLDLVINNKSSRPIVEFGGTNITEDVRAKISAAKKTGAPAGTPAASPAASASK